MSQRLRRFLETHGGGGSPLLELERDVRNNGPPGPARIAELSAELGLPPAAVRGAISFYADLQPPLEGFRICRGTSCALAGSGALLDEVTEQAAAMPVYCLGFCDRSPAALTPLAEVVLGEAAERLPEVNLENAEPPPPAVRSAAPEAIVTRHLAQRRYDGLGAAREAGVYRALAAALEGPPEAVLAAIEESGERGRGGAGFPTGAKWRRCAEAPGPEKMVIANGDEGDPGSFIDRLLMEEDPHSVLEGMALCAYATGAERGIVFIRSEYPRAIARMEEAIDAARQAGVLGSSVLGSGFAFRVHVFPALGSYVCGEETAMLNAIEGFRGEVRLRPPYPVDAGLYGLPTVVNNVETLVDAPWIVERGPAAYRALGTPESAGTKALCLNHGFARPGIVEVELGVPLRRVIEELGDGGSGGRRLDAVLLGGPMGSLLTPEEWDVPLCYGEMARRGIQLGHGGLVALPEGTDYPALFAHLVEFMRHESCGKCVPCRLGSLRAAELVEQRAGGDGRLPAAARPLLERLLRVAADASLCAFGQLTPGPMGTLLERFGDRIFAGGEGG